jgi:hypothetical protein
MGIDTAIQYQETNTDEHRDEGYTKVIEERAEFIKLSNCVNHDVRTAMADRTRFLVLVTGSTTPHTLHPTYTTVPIPVCDMYSQKIQHGGWRGLDKWLRPTVYPNIPI